MRGCIEGGTLESQHPRHAPLRLARHAPIRICSIRIAACSPLPAESFLQACQLLMRGWGGGGGGGVPSQMQSPRHDAVIGNRSQTQTRRDAMPRIEFPVTGPGPGDACRDESPSMRAGLRARAGNGGHVVQRQPATH